MAIFDLWGGSQKIDGPANNADEIVGDDNTDLAFATRQIYVGTGGDINMTTLGGQDVVFKNVPTGSMIAVRVKRLKATLTTASNIVGMW
jgi:hypothetical protein